MTSKIPEDHQLYDKPHRAIVLTVESKMTVPDAAEVTNAVTGYLEAAHDSGELLPVWLRFSDLQGREMFALQPHLAPTDREFLNTFILAIDGIDKHTTVSSFGYKTRQFPRKERKRTISKPLRRNDGEGAAVKSSGIAIPDPNRLPIALRFMACEEAMAEAKKLGQVYDRWPFFGFDKDDLRVWSEKLVVEFEDRYPYLAEADKVLDGKLTEVITELGKHPFQKSFELRRYWYAIQKGAVKAWTPLANELLAEIAKGAGNPYKHYEEANELTTATSYLDRDDRALVTKPANRSTKSIWGRCVPR